MNRFFCKAGSCLPASLAQVTTCATKENKTPQNHKGLVVAGVEFQQVIYHRLLSSPSDPSGESLQSFRLTQS